MPTGDPAVLRVELLGRRRHDGAAVDEVRATIATLSTQ